MSQLDDIAAALQKAHDAGDTEGAKQLADAYRALSAQATPQQPKWQPNVPNHGIPTDPMAAARAGAQATAQDSSFGQNAVAGFGKSFVDTWRGLKQIGYGVADAVSPSSSPRGAPLQAQIDADQPANDALNRTGGGFTGQVLGQGSQLLIPGSEAGKIAEAANLGLKGKVALQGLLGATQAGVQAVPTGGSRLQNTAVGAAGGIGGQLLGEGLGALATGGAGYMDAARAALIKLAQDEKIPLAASQLTNSRFAKTAASALNYLPLTGAKAAADAQQQGFNAAAARTMGATANTLGPEVMSGTKTNLSNGFNGIYQNHVIPIGEDAQKALNDVVAGANSNMTPEHAKLIAGKVGSLIDQSKKAQIAGPDGMTTGTITGNFYQDLRTSLDQMQPSPQVKQLKQTLDSIAEQSLGTDKMASLKDLRSKWGSMRTIEDALHGQAGAGGNLAPGSLWGPVVRRGEIYGNAGNLGDIARLGSEVIKDPIKDSGTAARNLVYSLLGLTGGGVETGHIGAALATLGSLGAAAGVGGTVGRVANSNALAKLLQNGAGRYGPGLSALAGRLPILGPALAIPSLPQQ